jgi:hypothetical protein
MKCKICGDDVQPGGGIKVVTMPTEVDWQKAPTPQAALALNAAFASADRIADAFIEGSGIELPGNKWKGPRHDLFYLCLRHPELPDEFFMEWLAQAYAAPAGKRRRLWKRLRPARHAFLLQVS